MIFLSFSLSFILYISLTLSHRSRVPSPFSPSSLSLRLRTLAFYSALHVSSSLSLSFLLRTRLRRDTNCFALVYAKLAVIACARETAGGTAAVEEEDRSKAHFTNVEAVFKLSSSISGPCSRLCCADEPPGIFRPCRCMANISVATYKSFARL